MRILTLVLIGAAAALVLFVGYQGFISPWQENEKRMADLKEKSSAMKAKWQSEKEEIEKMRALKEQLEEAKLELERARQAGDLNKAAELQYGKIPDLEKQLTAEQERLASLQKDGVFLKEEVDEEELARAEVVFPYVAIVLDTIEAAGAP